MEDCTSDKLFADYGADNKRTAVRFTKTVPCLHSESNNCPLNGGSAKCQHAENVYCLSCTCPDCWHFKSNLTLVAQDQFLTTDIWNDLKFALRTYYKPLFSRAANTTYEHYLANSRYDWQSVGKASPEKKEFLKANGTNTNEMKIAFDIAILQADDSHQLFELLSHETHCLIRAYGESISYKLGEGTYGDNALAKINYIIEGYEKIVAVAEKIESLICELQTNHLKLFNLNWTLLNKRFYQISVYSKFSEVAIHYLLKLKEEVSSNDYIEILSKYLKFNDEMVSVRRKWKLTWDTLNRYHMSSKDKARRGRLLMIYNAFESAMNLPASDCPQQIDVDNWDSFQDNESIWQNVIASIKNHWKKNDIQRLYATVRSDICVSCKTPTDNHKISCKCVTCLIAGPHFSSAKENFVRSLCYKCAVMQNALQELPDSQQFYINLKNVLKETKLDKVQCSYTKNERYHLSWAVFHNLEGREKYTYETINEDYFCENCIKIECSIARKIINMEVNYELATIAINFYRPLLLSKKDTEANIPCVLNFLRCFSTRNSITICEIKDPCLVAQLSFCLSILVAHYCNVKTKTHKLYLDNLEISAGDIKLKSGLLKNISFESSLKYILSLNGKFVDSQNDENCDKCQVQKIGDLCVCASLLSEEQEYPTKSELMISQQDQSTIKKIDLITMEKKSSHAGNINTTCLMKTNRVKKQVESGQCLDAWVKETLNYIEGDRKEKCTDKKLEKRNRQKLKKEERKRIEELHILKSQYQDLYFKEFFAKQELKNYKSSKKKDKKKVLEIETNIKKLNLAKLKIERNILESLHVVKSINSNFKLSYLPTKEELNNATVNMANILDVTGYRKCTTNDLPNENIMDENIVTNNSTSQEETQNVDGSKRIVTIRRVTIPYSSEPQVTVTAKGKSPKEDQLLYTFINGQIIPASSMDTHMIDILKTQTPGLAINNSKDITIVSEPVGKRLVGNIPSASIELLNNNVTISTRETGANQQTLNNSFLLGTSKPECFSSAQSDQLDEIANMNKKSFLTMVKPSFERHCDKKFIHKFLPEDSTNIVCQSIKNLHIDDVPENNPTEKRDLSYVHLNGSIMEQINNGIQVENLTLPPGITLTRVDPLKAEKMKSKRESIEKLSYRMQYAEYPIPCNENASIDIQLANHSGNRHTLPEAESKQNRRKKRKCKKQSIGFTEEQTAHRNISSLNKTFQNEGCNNVLLNIPSDIAAMKNSCVQSAAIIKNENGMFTIRNPTIYPNILSNSTEGVLTTLPVRCKK